MAERRIVLVDADCFFASVVRVLDICGAGKAHAIIVGGSPESRGTVSSACYVARKRGVRAGMPTSMAVRLCPRALVVPVPREVRSESERIRASLERALPLVVPASIDEWYGDATGLCDGAGLPEGQAFAEQVRNTVLSETGYSVSVGLASNMLVAKLASEERKPGGAFAVPAGGEQDFLLGFQARDLHGIGPAFAAQLASRGIRTVGDIRAFGLAALTLWLGPTNAGWLWDSAHGRDSRVLQPHGPAKSASRERTFAEDVQDDAILRTELLRLVARVGADVREEGRPARTLTVKLRDTAFKDHQASETIPGGLTSDRAIAEVAARLMVRLREGRATGPVRLIGLGARFEEATLDAEEQPDLFLETSVADDERDIRVSKTADEIRSRFGRHAIGSAAVLPKAESRRPVQ